LANVPAAVAGESVLPRLAAVDSLKELDAGKKAILVELAELATRPALDAAATAWLGRLREAGEGSTADRLLTPCRAPADRAAALAAGMDFRFLYKPERHLFAVGYNATQGRLDAACYDLLASEARLTSFLAVARGDVPPRHWFHLGRLVTRVGGQLCLVSWGGTMFEYLMPDLSLRRYPGTLLAESDAAAVARQIAYGRERGVPWGVSESAFSSQYVSLDYQYQAFGVPGLGLKRGLGQD